MDFNFLLAIYTIEFQQIGLPHARILIFPDKDSKIILTDQIDEIISVEIPDPNNAPVAHRIVKKLMVHSPCGSGLKTPVCLKSQVQQIFSQEVLRANCDWWRWVPNCKRRDTGLAIKRKGIELDNQYIVPYNGNLLVRFNAHINIEACNHSRSIKYLVKYISKGPDQVTVVVEKDGQQLNKVHDQENAKLDEIKQLLDCRYISAPEACWRIFQFDLHYRKSAVECLPFHLLDEHTVVFDEDTDLENLLNRPGIEKTKFTGWFIASNLYPEARSLTYSDFATCWV